MMRKRIKVLVRCGFVILLAAGMILTGYSAYQNHTAAESYRQAQELAESSRTEDILSETESGWSGADQVYEHQGTMAVLKQINVKKLQEVNGDVIGWIVIPDTQIAYPLMGGAGNEYYLKHTWKKEANSSGAIFVEEKNRLDFQNHNTIVYGHNMRNGSMFGSLKEYQKQDYWEQHPEIYIRTGENCYRYEIFAAYEASVNGLAYQVGFEGEESKQKFLEDCIGRSVIRTGIVPAEEDQILTLSTCTGRGYDTRWVVQARLAEME